MQKEWLRNIQLLAVPRGFVGTPQQPVVQRHDHDHDQWGERVSSTGTGYFLIEKKTIWSKESYKSIK